MYLDSTDIELVTDFEAPTAGVQKIGLRLTAMTIPAGATITGAHLTFRALAADATNVTIRDQLIVNAPTFTSTSSNISSRTLTTAAASRVPRPWTTGTDYDSPSIVSVIQEIVNQGAWASGDAIAIIITGTGQRASQSYDTGPANVARLVVSHTSATISGTVFEDSNYGGRSAVAEINRIGEQNPSIADAGNGSAGTVINTTTGVFTAVVTGTAQSITNVALGASDITGVDFGHNFNTIVNTNDSGQGPLRQFIDNANALSNPGLAQSGLPAGIDTSLFEIPTTDPNYQAAPLSYTITPALNYVPLTDAIRIDGSTILGCSEVEEHSERQCGRLDVERCLIT